MNRAHLARIGAGASALLGVGAVVYVAAVTGRLTVDLGVGRRSRPLGPIVRDIAAPPETVHQVLTAPYAERRPRAMATKIDILERSAGAVLAAHHTAIGFGLTATTVETVRFEDADRIHFRLVRGPVPLVTETFTLESVDGGTRLRYEGSMETDLWGLGAAWGSLVATTWEASVASSMDSTAKESERIATIGLR